MADEDEIDVLGDFSLDNFLCKNESGISSCYENSVLTSQGSDLGCDYSLHPQWLLENSPTNWYSSSGNDFSTDDGHSATNTSLGFDEVICTDNKTDETGWTEEEKSLLQKGLEIFGKSSIRLSQFISSKSPSQVKHYLKNYYSIKNPLNTSYLLNNPYGNNADKQSHVNEAVVSSEGLDLPEGIKMSDIIEDAQIPASIEEVIAVVSTAKPTVQNIQKKSPKKKLTSRNDLEFAHSILKHRTFVPKKKIKQINSSSLKQRKQKIKSKLLDTTLSESTDGFLSDSSVTNKLIPRVLPVSSGEEVIKIRKENSDSESDTEIDIDIDIDNSLIERDEVLNHSSENDQKINEKILPKPEETNEENQNKIDPLDLGNIDEKILNFLTCLDVPSKPCYIKENEITDVEKYVHLKFFEGRPSKTPMKYLKIRNHIVDCWLSNRPMYCTKTSVRQGLKNCGDVNCIGRIHQYLEQTGVINFGCVQTNYIRPLVQIFSVSRTSIHSKDKINFQSSSSLKNRNELARPRMKKKYNNDGEGGYTMAHNENGDVIEMTIVNKDKQNKPRINRRQNIKLVYCKNFTDEYMAPYVVNMDISALLMIDIHAHSATIEVMGLLGGKYDGESQNLHITQYVPCRGTDHSNTHCDMCPVSQSEASEIIQSEKLEVIGWFHSHPTFFPNPSQQDIDTQLNMQLYLSNKYSPFVGVILSPFRPLTTTLASEYRCLIVDKNQSTKDGNGVPYKFQVNITSDYLNVSKLLKRARYAFTMQHNIPKEYMVDFEKPYFQDNSITYLDKLLASVKLHLARCTDVNKMTCDAIIEGITNLCLGTLD